jgi:[ribosomal protein S5]-alanine N-acetyltransferase
MFELQRLGPDHEAAVLDFESANRDYFAQSISDRGDDFFEEFAQRHRELLTEQESGAGAFYVLVDDETIVGRFNLYDIADGSANVGYRVAQRVAGHGVATTAVQNLCRRASQQYGLRTLRATTNKENIASQRVLEKSGFVVVGSAMAGPRVGLLYELVLPVI